METDDNYNKLRAAIDLEKRNLKRLNTQRNVALGVDVASNLASMLARSRGARYSLSTNNTAAVNRKISESEQRMLDAQRDYNGRLAALAFRSLLNNENKVAPVASYANTPSAGRVTQRKQLFPEPIRLIRPKLPIRPQMIEIQPFTPVKSKYLKYNN